MVQDPAKFGFTNVDSPCVSLGDISSCGNPEGHVFWDNIHPTSRADGFIAAAFASAVPEPEMISMFIAGLIVLGFAGGTGGMWRKRGYAQLGVGSPHGMSSS